MFITHIKKYIFKKSILGFFIFVSILAPILNISVGEQNDISFIPSHVSAQVNSGTTIPTEENAFDREDRELGEAMRKTQAQKQDTSSVNEIAKAKTTGIGIVDGLVRWIGTAIIAIPSAFLWIGGSLLEWTLNLVVFQMGGRLNPGTPLGASINQMWELIRDICNLAFIFGFIYIGIKTIIDPDSTTTKRFLSKNNC